MHLNHRDTNHDTAPEKNKDAVKYREWSDEESDKKSDEDALIIHPTSHLAFGQTDYLQHRDGRWHCQFCYSNSTEEVDVWDHIKTIHMQGRVEEPGIHMKCICFRRGFGIEGKERKSVILSF